MELNVPALIPRRADPGSFPWSWVLVPVATAVVVAALELSGGLEAWELPLRDAIVRAAPEAPSGRFAVVEIDERSLDALGAWPWPRERIAEIVAGARAREARAVAVDVVLAGESPGDDVLAAALAAGPSILAAAFRSDDRWLLPARRLADSGRVAHALLERDDDGVLRRIAGTKQAEGRSCVAFAAEVAAASGMTDPVPAGGAIVPSFRVTPASIPAMSAVDLLRNPERSLSRDLSIEGRVVLVGVTAPGHVDQVPAPSTRRGDLDAGVRVQAAAAESIARGDLFHPVAPIVSALVAALLAAASLAAGRLGGWRRIGTGGVVVFAPLLLGPPLLLATGWSVPVLTLSLASAVPFVVSLVRTELSVFRSSEKALARIGSDVPPRTTEARVERLSELSGELERLRREEGEIRRTMAHELKTPLGSIRGLSQLLAGFDLDPSEARRVAELVGRETGRLARMIDELLALEKIALRSFRQEAVRIDLTRLVAGRIDPIVRSGSASIRFEAAAPVWILGEPALLERVVENLLGNATKFSPAGSLVRVRVGFGKDGEAILEVEDRGPGIPEGERSAIFRRFRRGSSAGGTEGLGLGLALVAESVSWHGGRVEVEPAEPNGSLFRLHFPLAEPDRDEERAASV